MKAIRALVKEHKDDPAAFDGVLLLVGPMRSFLDAETVPVASRYLLRDPRAGELALSIRHRHGEAWAEGLLKDAAEKHPREDVRGQATFALGDYYRNTAFPWWRALPEEEVARWVAKAEACYKAAAKDFAAVRTPDGKHTIGDKAAHELARLTNLPNLKVGKPAPEIAGETLGGKPMKLSDHRGKVVVVVFWGSWCGPCMARVPHERELFRRHQGKPFVLLGINCGDTREKAKETASKREMAWESLWDGDEIRGPIETDYNVQHWPTVYVIDPKGVIRAFDPEEKELDEVVDALLTGPESPGR